VSVYVYSCLVTRRTIYKKLCVSVYLCINCTVGHCVYNFYHATQLL